jgi:hypothetical protein
MIAHLAAAAALIAAQTGAGSEPVRCIDEQQMADLTIALAPAFIETVGATCARHPGTTPFIRSAAGAQLVQRSRAAATASAASAVSAIETMTGRRLPAGIPPQVAMAVAVPAFAAELPPMTPTRCRSADNMIAAAAPLPPANLGRLVASVFAFAGEGRGAPNLVCPQR